MAVAVAVPVVSRSSSSGSRRRRKRRRRSSSSRRGGGGGVVVAVVVVVVVVVVGTKTCLDLKLDRILKFLPYPVRQYWRSICSLPAALQGMQGATAKCGFRA